MTTDPITQLIRHTLIASLLLLSSGAVPRNAMASRALIAPASVSIAGSLQSKLGCAGDWDPACASTFLTYDTDDDVWQGTWVVPPGNWEYKAALNGSWSENYGTNAQAGGANIALNLPSTTTVKFYYDHKSHWVTENRNRIIAVAPGSFQSKLGCPGDWQPDCLRSWLQDADGDGIYTFETTAIPAGSYEGKVAINESWTENYGVGGVSGGANIAFTVVTNGQRVLFRYDSNTHVLTITPIAVGAAQDNNVWWDDLYHDSRSTLYRTPGGAVSTGTNVTLRFRSAKNDLTAARVRVWNDRVNVQSVLDMTKVSSDASYDYWQAPALSSTVPTIFYYRFIALDGTSSAYYEDDEARTGGAGKTYAASPDNGWQITVYDPAFHTPDWVKNAIIYQIFPDRFRDGNSANNNAAGEFFYGANSTIVRSNSADWNTAICDPRSAAGTVAACADNYSDNFYGGDLQGLLNKLDYLQDLGVTAIYLNPIFKSPSNHKYDTSDYGVIDPHLGELGTFQALAAQAESRGIRLILDGVFNHVSSDSPYMDRYGRFAATGACESASSPYRDWFYFTDVAAGTGVCVGSTGAPKSANYESWFGFDSLPKLRSNSSEVRNLVWASPTVSTGSSVAKYWLQNGADGWRLDVAGDVDPGLTNDPANDYWEGFRTAVRTTDSQSYIVGEEWGVSTGWTLGAEWDATMNYQFSSALLSFWRDSVFADNDHNTSSSAGELKPLSPSQVNERLLNLQERYPPEAWYAMMNLLGSHDTARALFMLDHNVNNNNTALYANSNYDWSDAIARLKGVALMQMTLPGAPTIYYGDEVGLVGPPSFVGGKWEDDPYNRQPMPWLDETGTPFYKHLQTQAAQDAQRDYYKQLTRARNTHPALRTGDFKPLRVDDAAKVYAYGRKLVNNSDAALTLVNRDTSAKSITVNVAGYIAAGSVFSNVLDGTLYTATATGDVTVPAVSARGGALLVLAAPMPFSPGAPVLSLASVAAGRVSLSWTATPESSSFDVYRSSTSGGGYTLIGSSSGLTYTDTTVQNGSRYFYVVVARNNSTGLTSPNSNEVSALPALVPGWWNLQWPPTLNHTLGITPTTDVYGQIWIDGVTNAAGATPGVQAQLGFGPVGSTPDASWAWRNMAFNLDAGNNDEFKGAMLPTRAGVYDYVTRYSTNGGQSWYYGGNGGPLGGSNRPGTLTVTQNSDITPPGLTSNLRVVGTTPAQIDLAWNANPAPDLAGYELYRKGVSDTTYILIGTLPTSPTTFSDGSVVAGTTYDYALVAFDAGYNRSAQAMAQAQAVARNVQTRFEVTVPDCTPGSVYIAGSIPGLPSWNPGATPMVKISNTLYAITLTMPDGASLEFKFTRGAWDKVEKEGDGNGEIANRSATVAYGSTGAQTLALSVANWRDPIVCAQSPANGATNVARNSVITARWNQAMPAGSSFVISSSGGLISGTFTTDSSNLTTFTPSSPLPAGARIEVNIAGLKDAGGDTQQDATAWSFATVPNKKVYYFPIVSR